MKFHCYVRALPAAPTPGAGVLLDAILSGASQGWAFGVGRTRCSTHRRRQLTVSPPPMPPQPMTLPPWCLSSAGISFMTALAHRRRVGSAHHGLEVPCATRLPDAHVRWLGLTAFLRVLRRKQARYRPLLAALAELEAAPALRGAARQLASVVDPARSSVFEAILY